MKLVPSLLAAGQLLAVNAIPHRHQYHRQANAAGDTESVNLSTVIGTLNLVSSASSINALTILAPTILTSPATDNVAGTSTTTDTVSSASTITVTTTDIVIVTATLSDSTANDPTVTVAANVDSGGFGGSPGQVAASNAATGGDSFTLGGVGAFGGTLGVITISRTDPAQAATTTTTSSTSITSTTAASTPTVINIDDNGAFGGVPGSVVVAASQANDVVASTVSFVGFGGIPGLVPASAQTDIATPSTSPASYNKRGIFEASGNVSDAQTGMSGDSISLIS